MCPLVKTALRARDNNNLERLRSAVQNIREDWHPPVPRGIRTRLPHCILVLWINCFTPKSWTKTTQELFVIVIWSVFRRISKRWSDNRRSWWMICRQIVQTVPNSCRLSSDSIRAFLPDARKQFVASDRSVWIGHRLGYIRLCISGNAALQVWKRVADGTIKIPWHMRPLHNEWLTRPDWDAYVIYSRRWKC